MNSITKYFREAYQELKKVIWPNRSETTKHTLMVIAISLAVAAFLGALDYILNQIIDRFIV